MTSKSIAQVAAYRPLSRCGPEELAVHQITAPLSGGIAFARKVEHEEKDRARLHVLEEFNSQRFPNGLSILTMPGVNWKFERKLFGKREGDWFRKKSPHRTYVTSVENDRVIYLGAITQMPGLQHSNSVNVVLPPTDFAEHVVRNRWIGRYFFANVDDLMKAHPKDLPYDGAWLDYTGPMTEERMRVVKRFYNECIRDTLVVTALKARWNLHTSEAITRAGGYFEWMRKHLPGTILHELEYQDGPSPMAQYAVTKRSTA